MRKNITRVGLLSAGLGAAALTVTGFALPASADSWSSTEETQTTIAAPASLEAFQDLLRDALLANGNTVDTGDAAVGGLVDGGLVNGPLISDIGNGALLSGNDAPVLSGNDVQAPVASGNDVSVEAPVGSGNEVANGNEVASGNSSDVSVGGLGAEVGDLTNGVGDVSGEVGDVVGDVSSEVDGLVGGLLD